ncbi:hypothetical protein ACIBG0_13855 [Nocardia sp. NPDC050630]|uniref:hypothetical protein n=1 Tax=Nocardia sp. NPDC050630 TaxID=3364321 RepID=UPI0037B2B38D
MIALEGLGIDHRQLPGNAVGGLAAFPEGGDDALVVQPGARVVPVSGIQLWNRVFQEVEQVTAATAEGGANGGEGGGAEGPVPFVGRVGTAGVVAVEDQITGAGDPGSHRYGVGFDEETADVGAGAGGGVIGGLYLEPGRRETGKREYGGEGDLPPDIGQIVFPTDLTRVQKHQAPRDQRRDARQPQRRRMTDQTERGAGLGR